MSKDKDIKMTCYDVASAPARIGTTGLGPCIGVCVLNNTQKMAWVAHVSAPSVSDTVLEEMLQEAKGSSDDADDVQIWCVGGCVNPNDKDDAKSGVTKQVRNDRRFAETTAKSIFPGATIRTKFSDDPAAQDMDVWLTYLESDGRWDVKIDTYP